MATESGHHDTHDGGTLSLLFVAKRLGWGGMTRSLGDTASELVRMGHRVALHTKDGGAIRAHTPALEAAGVTVERVSSLTTAGLRGAVERHGADAARLFTGTFPPNTTVNRKLVGVRCGGAFGLSGLGVPVVESIHQMSVGMPRLSQRLFYRVMKRDNYRAAVLSRGMLDESVRRLPGMRDSFVQLPFGMHVPERGLEPVGDGVVRLVTVTRLDQEHKDTATLVRALGSIERSGGVASEWRCTIIGDGPDADVLKQLAASEGIADRCEWLGRIEDPVSVMRRSDVFVLATKYEGFGRVNIEAAAVGLPVVASDALGCHDSVANGENGVLVAREDVDAHAAALRRLIDDEGERRRLGERGPAFAQRFTPRAHCEAFIELVRGMIAEA